MGGLESGTMTGFLVSLLTICAATASAQTVRAPALGRSALPGFGSLSAVAGGLAAGAVSLPSAPSLAAPLAFPVLPSPALQSPRPAVAALSASPLSPLPPAGEGGVRAAAVLESASVPLARAEGDPAAQAPVLASLFEGGRTASAGAVMASDQAPRPSLLSRPMNAAADETPPPPPARPAWKTAGLYALRTAGFLGALYGGFRVGDFAYLGAQFLGAWGLALSLPLLGAAAWWLGRRRDSSPLGRSVIGGLFASAGFVVVGQQVWDLVQSPLGLFVGIPVGALLALVASGLLPRKRKFTGEPPNLNPRLNRQ